MWTGSGRCWTCLSWMCDRLFRTVLTLPKHVVTYDLNNICGSFSVICGLVALACYQACYSRSTCMNNSALTSQAALPHAPQCMFTRVCCVPVCLWILTPGMKLHGIAAAADQAAVQLTQLASTAWLLQTQCRAVYCSFVRIVQMRYALHSVHGGKQNVMLTNISHSSPPGGPIFKDLEHGTPVHDRVKFYFIEAYRQCHSHRVTMHGAP